MFRKIEKLSEAIDRNVKDALFEDIGFGDRAEAIIPAKNVIAEVKCNARQAVLSGQLWFDKCFQFIDKSVSIEWLKRDGSQVLEGDKICRMTGQSLSILAGERSALNFLQVLSSTSTRTREYLNVLKDSGIQNCVIVDTRKTLPGLRLAQKYAVRLGGGANQRFGLWDALLVKENHLITLGGLKKLANLIGVIDSIDKDKKLLQIEVETMEEYKHAMSLGFKHILLDNFSINELAKAVENRITGVTLEASGGINLNNLLGYIRTGVDRISIGDLTKNINSVDFSLRIVEQNND